MEDDGMKYAEGDKPRQDSQPTELDRQYGKIGISAVAAALHYQSDAKNLAYAPVVVQFVERSEDLAA
jgi:hypothetical protein